MRVRSFRIMIIFVDSLIENTNINLIPSILDFEVTELSKCGLTPQVRGKEPSVDDRDRFKGNIFFLAIPDNIKNLTLQLNYLYHVLVDMIDKKLEEMREAAEAFMEWAMKILQ